MTDARDIDDLETAKKVIDDLRYELRNLSTEFEEWQLNKTCPAPKAHDQLIDLVDEIRNEHDRRHADAWSICAYTVCRLAAQARLDR